jgi:hypothetical protein
LSAFVIISLFVSILFFIFIICFNSSLAFLLLFGCFYWYLVFSLWLHAYSKGKGKVVPGLN